MATRKNNPTSAETAQGAPQEPEATAPLPSRELLTERLEAAALRLCGVSDIVAICIGALEGVNMPNHASSCVEGALRGAREFLGTTIEQLDEFTILNVEAQS